MKNILICFCLFITSAGFSQSRKKQIESLTLKMDSLLQSNRNQTDSFMNIENYLHDEIKQQKNSLINLRDTLAILKNKLFKKEQEIQEVKLQVDKLKSDLAIINDSIESELNDEPIEFLDSSEMDLNDETAIKLINMPESNLKEAFNLNENQKLNLEVYGKQFFALGKNKYCMVVWGESQNDCLGCMGTTFVVCFEKKNSEWKMIRKEFNAGNGGNSGRPKEVQKFIVIGKRNLAVILLSGSFNIGITRVSQVVYGLDNQNNIREYYSCVNWEDDPKAPYEIQLSFKESGN